MDSNSLKAPIRKLNPHEPICCESGSLAGDAINALQRNRIGCILVVYRGKLTGILSERDVVRKLSSQDFEPGALAIEALASTDPDVLQMDDMIAFAMNRMHISGYRHIPVVDREERPVGIISIKDLIRYVVEELDGHHEPAGAALPLHGLSLDDENLDDEMMQMAEQSESARVVLSNQTFTLPLSAVYSRNPISVTAETPLRQAVQIMVERGISSLPVVEGVRDLRGIFTDNDVLMKLAGKGIDLDKIPIGKMMQQNPQTLKPQDPLAAALRLMNEGHYRHVPLMGGEGHLEGMVSIRDIIGYIAQHFLGEILNLPPQPIRRAMHAMEGA